MIRSLDVQIEDSLAGCLLLEPTKTIDAIRGEITEEDFLSQNARAIYKAVKDLVFRGEPTDCNLILQRATEQGQAVDTEYCKEAMMLTPTTVNAGEYAKAIHAGAIKRRGRDIGFELANDEIDANQAFSQLQDLLQNQRAELQTPLEVANQFADYINDVANGKIQMFTRTGIPKLDEVLSGGLVEGGLVTVAARPGTGKTTVAINIAENIAEKSGPILYISLEMTAMQIFACRLSAYSGLNRSNISGASFQKDDTKSWSILAKSMADISDRPFIIRDKPSTIEDIETAARSIKDLKLIVVDHIGLIKNESRGGSRYEIMTEIAHKLKQMALALRVPILALCQLNRSSVSRETKRPTMSDLRDSGAIEEDSDVVILLFREAQYLPEEEKPKPYEPQQMLLIVDKNRHGITATVGVDYCGSNSRILGV